jgi:hypothetical protein
VRVRREHGVPRDRVSVGHRVEHPARVGGARAAGVHLEEAVGDEGGGDEPGHEHARVRGAARGEERAAAIGAELEEAGEGEVGEGPRLRGWRARHRDLWERAKLEVEVMC